MTLLSILSLSLLLVLEASVAESFTKQVEGCIGGFSDVNNCPKKYEFVGGPGYVGHRLDWPVKMLCSPSCTKNSNPKLCSLILALHGIYSNPKDQEWLMVGGEAAYATSDAFNEDLSVGGPYCISFHKAKNHAWEYKCGGDDEGKKSKSVQP